MPNEHGKDEKDSHLKLTPERDWRGVERVKGMMI